VRPTPLNTVLTQGRPETVLGAWSASPQALADDPHVSSGAGWALASPGRPHANDNAQALHTGAASDSVTPTPLHAAMAGSLHHNPPRDADTPWRVAPRGPDTLWRGTPTPQGAATPPLAGDPVPLLGVMEVGRQGEARSIHPMELRRDDGNGPVMATGAHKAVEATPAHGRGARANPAPAEPGSIQPLPVTPARHDQASATVKEQPRAGVLLAPIVEGVVVRQALLRTGVGAASFHIVLQPQALGMVTIHVEQTGQGMQVTLTPQHVETSVLLDRHAPDLMGLLGADNNGGVSVTVLAPDGRHVGAHTTAGAPASTVGGAPAGFSQGLTGGGGGQSSPMGQGAGSPWTGAGAEVAENAPRAATVSSAGIERSPVRPSRFGGLSGVTRIDIQI